MVEHVNKMVFVKLDLDSVRVKTVLSTEVQKGHT